MSLVATIRRLVQAGYPESTARKIATGELPMDRESRMARAREMGYTTDALHAGAPNVLEFDPQAPRRTVDEGYAEDALGSFFTDDPVIAASYSGPESATYRVLLKTDNYGRVDADSSFYDALDGKQYVRPSGEVVDSVDAANTYLGKMPSQTDDFGVIAKNVGDQGVVIDNVIDMGPKTKPMRLVADEVSGGDRSAYLDRLQEQGAKTFIAQDPSTIRSYYSAAFDPDMARSGNIMASRPEAAVGGLLSAGDFDAVRAALNEEEGYQYYDVLPIRKNLMGREQPYELALPNLIRDPVRALLDLSEQLETGERNPSKAMGLLF